MFWKILILINLILSAWSVFGVICITQTIKLMQDVEKLKDANGR